MRIPSLITACGVVGLLGCSGETVPAAANLAGTWDFSYVTKSDAGVTCRGTMAFTISQSDQTFSGVQRDPGSLVCDGATPNFASTNPANPSEFDGETMTSGVVSPNELAFRLNNLRSEDAGVVVDDGALSGRTTWVIPIKPKGTITVSGTWTASKRSQ